MYQIPDNISSVDVIIPLYRPDGLLEIILKRLAMQTVKPDRVLLLNTESYPDFSTESLKERLKIEASTWKVPGSEKIEFRFLTIDKKEFNHGGTRNFGADHTKANYILFMTQDAVPSDTHLIEVLLSSFERYDVAISYARQLPGETAVPAEKLIRSYNYPEESRIKTSDDLNELGIKTYFCSNVCAMYKREIYNDLGGFERDVIFGEDMLYASKAIEEGYAIAYEAQALVTHSHNMSYPQQFRRNFDIGVSHAMHPEVYKTVSSEKEGMQMVKNNVKILYDKKEYFAIPDYIIQSGMKYLGYTAGKNYRKLPEKTVKRFSLNRDFWENDF